MASSNVRVFINTAITQSALIKAYAAELKRIKSKPSYQSKSFGVGRDFSRPENAKLAGLMHYHLIDAEHNPRTKTSDRFLVYCSGFSNPNDYLLIAIIEPEAHKQTNKGSTMACLIQIAENFRNQF